MKGMKSTSEFYTPPPKGDHPAIISAAEPGRSAKSGATMITISATLKDRNESFKTYIITQGGAPGAGMGKQLLRGLGVNVDTDDEVPDEVICNDLVGRETLVVLDHEQNADFNAVTKEYDIPRFNMLPDGTQVPAMRGVVKGFKRIATSQLQPAPQQQYAQAPQQQYAPAPTTNAAVAVAPQQGGYVQAPPQYAPQYAPQAQPQYAQAPLPPPGYAPQAQPQYAGAPQPAYAQGPAPQYAQAPIQQQAQPGWVSPPQPNGAETDAKKGKRKLNIKEAGGETQG